MLQLQNEISFIFFFYLLLPVVSRYSFVGSKFMLNVNLCQMDFRACKECHKVAFKCSTNFGVGPKGEEVLRKDDDEDDDDDGVGHSAKAAFVHHLQ